LAPFAVGVTFKTPSVPANGGYSPNVVQKGLFNGRGGQWKMELVNSRSRTIARCRLSGARGHHAVLDHSRTSLDDGRWHTVVCWRTAFAYGISVDGAQSHLAGNVGLIKNSQPLRVASKSLHAAGITDQFQGTIDCVAYVQGPHPLNLAAAKAHC
jgi:hypothetical protein